MSRIYPPPPKSTSNTNLTVSPGNSRFTSPTASPSLGSAASREAPESGGRIFDSQWQAVQKKTFTNWINTRSENGELQVEDLYQDFASGEKLIQLVEILTKESLGRRNANPKLRIQKVENINKALQALKLQGIQMVNIGAEDVADSNDKLILGLVWLLIQKYSIAEISEEGKTAKEGLLLWCQRKTQPYKPTVNITDFTKSWQDGLGLCALIHRHRPDLLDFYKLDKSDRLGNATLAMDVAQKHLGIPKLMSPEDLVNTPDEKSNMTYIAQYHHAFASMDKVDTAARRVANFTNVLASTWSLQHDYENRASELLHAINDQINAWKGLELTGGYREAKKHLNSVDQYKQKKRSWAMEKRDIETLLASIQTKLKTYSLAPYICPEGLTSEDVENWWETLVESEVDTKKKITSYIAKTKQDLKTNSAQAANGFEDKLNEISKQLLAINPQLPLDQQIKQVTEVGNKLKPLHQTLATIEPIFKECDEAGIDDNEQTIYNMDDLKFDLDTLETAVKKKASFLQNQTVLRTKTDISPEKLEEYDTAFKALDRDQSNSLNRVEFKAALSALGFAYEDQEFEKLFLQVSKGGDEITFEPYIDWAKSVEEDKITPDQLLDAFTALAGDKGHVSADDLIRAGVSKENAETLVGQMQGDFKSYLKQAFV